MKLFFKYIGEFVRTYPQVKFSKNDEIKIRNLTLRHLGLTNLNQMRDRFEGQAFFQKTMKNLGGLIALENHLNVEQTDIEQVDLANFKPYIELDNKKIIINVFDFGDLPSVDIKEIKTPTFFIIQKDNLTFLLCGLASKEVIVNNLIESSSVKSNSHLFKNFIGFKFLDQIK